MTTSQVNKIKRDLLAAHNAAKDRVCRMIISPNRSYALRHYSKTHLDQFQELIGAKDFEGAVLYLHDKMLPYLKKNSPADYSSELMMISVELTLTYSFRPQFKDMFDQALGASNYYGILKGLNKMTEAKYSEKCLGDLLYVFEETMKRPAADIPPYVKHCLFHLFARFITRRETKKLMKLQLEPYFTYYQDKYHCFDESDPLEKAIFQFNIRQNDFKPAWDQFFNPSGKPGTKRTTIDDLRKMMNEMDQRHAEEVHYLFMSNYIDFSDYEFRDDWHMDAYHEAYFYYFRSGDVQLEILNDYVLDILKEWQQDANHKYQKAKKDLIWWITDPIPEFKPSLGKGIEMAYKTAIRSNEEEKLAKALTPFLPKIVEIVKSGQYEDAAANIFCLFEHLALADKEHEDWFHPLWGNGTMTQVAYLTEALCELYCHLRQQKELSVSLKDEMNIHLKIFNNKTYFFGDMWCGSRFEDLTLDPKDQEGDYSDLEECSVWKYWYLRRNTE